VDLMLFEECGEFVGKIVLVDSLAMGVGCVLLNGLLGCFRCDTSHECYVGDFWILFIN